MTTIFEEQTITFYPDEGFGGLCFGDIGAAVELTEGETYDVIFDGVTYACIAEHLRLDSFEGIGLGNKAIVGIGDDTGEPFIIGVVGYYTMALTFEFEETSHTIGIYTHDEADEPEEPEEPQGIILRNYHGENVVHEGIETITFGNTDGGTTTFTRGIALDNVPILLDFSDGDQKVTADEETLIKSAIIEKPENLIPENIADGINIGGIIGTHKGGGGSSQEVKCKFGTYTATAEVMNVTHNLGILPDIVAVSARIVNYTGLNYLFGKIYSVAKEIADGSQEQHATWLVNNSLTNASSDDMYESNDDLMGLIQSPTPKTFMVGSTYIKHSVGATYDYMVIGGIVERKFINVQLSLDGDGNLIISGGVPEIEQFNVYVDGTLAKTVDYTYSDDDFIVDISDVAGEAKEYTISVDGVGSEISEKYQMAFYEPVTGYNVPRAQGSCGASVNYKLYYDGTLRIYGTGAMDDYSGASGQPWYSNASMIKSVIVDDGVTRIGNQSLRQLTSMTNISIADSVTTYGTSAFLGSTALSSITISANVTTINAYAFNECTGLKTAYYEGTIEQWCKVNFGGTGANPCFVGNATLYIGGETVVNAVIPDSVTTLNAHVFTNCKTLESVTMQNSVTSIGTRAFYGCTSLQSITIPDSVTSIGTYAFYGCTSLQSIDISNNITAIPNYFAYNCAKLANITIPGSVTSIGSYAFNNCAALTSAILSDNLTSVGEYAFSATAITSIVIPYKVTQILWRAFQNCTKLTSVTIGSAVNLIGDNAFYGCSALTSATFKDTTTWRYNSSQTSTTGTTISSSYLSSTSTAATYLRSSYVGYWWHKV